MDSPTSNLDRWKKMAADRRVKAFVLAVLILVTIVVLQVSNLKQHTPMCELFESCKLRASDVHRIEFALSKAGLTEFEVDAGRLCVPKTEHSRYLQAIAEQNAIPPELRDTDANVVIANPFLSRSQQLAIERASRKQHIQEMVIRLPFVESAWFEMDESNSGTAFRKPEKSAVISIRPIEHQVLQDQHVETVRQMITGAIAGMESKQIVVIDLSTGFAHRNSQSKGPADRRIEAQRVAFARKQMLEDHLRESLSQYPGLQVAVRVDAVEEDNQVANAGGERLSKPENTPSNQRVHGFPLTAGANGQVSLADLNVPTNSDPQIAEVTHTQPATTAEFSKSREKVSIEIDVPYSLLVQRYGEPSKPLSYTTRTAGYENSQGVDQTDQFDQNFAELKSEIERIVRPLIGPGIDAQEIPISFNVIRPATIPGNQWFDTLRGFAVENWPSIAVLVIGLMLISLVTQQGRAEASRLAQRDTEPVGDVVSFHSKPDSVVHKDVIHEDERKREVEARLSRMIEQDPEAAARVIESWIRDAA